MEVWAAAKDFETTLSRGTAGGLLSLFIEGALFFLSKVDPQFPDSTPAVSGRGGMPVSGKGKFSAVSDTGK